MKRLHLLPNKRKNNHTLKVNSILISVLFISIVLQECFSELSHHYRSNGMSMNEMGIYREPYKSKAPDTVNWVKQPNTNLETDHSNNFTAIRALNKLIRLFHGSKAMFQKVTCPELNNKTFTNDKPFDVLGIPRCREEARPVMKLYFPVQKNERHKKSKCELDPFYIPNIKTTKCFKKLKERNDINKVVVIVHGFLNNFKDQWMHDMKREIQSKDSKNTSVAVIIVGWGDGFWNELLVERYMKVAQNTRYVGYALFLMLKEMHRIVSTGKLFVHCIGHSLGAHICGFAGKNLIGNNTNKLKFDRISGLDPAGPMFTEDSSWPYDYRHINPDARIASTDAKFVDIYHTDGKGRYCWGTLCLYIQFGTMIPLGTADFYIGTPPYYGYYQTDCYDELLLNLVGCSHRRAHEIFLSTIKGFNCTASPIPYAYLGPLCYPRTIFRLYCFRYLADNYKPSKHGLKSTKNRSFLEIPSDWREHDSESVSRVGYWLKPTVSGSFTVAVSGKKPFCRNH